MWQPEYTGLPLSDFFFLLLLWLQMKSHWGLAVICNGTPLKVMLAAATSSSCEYAAVVPPAKIKGEKTKLNETLMVVDEVLSLRLWGILPCLVFVLGRIPNPFLILNFFPSILALQTMCKGYHVLGNETTLKCSLAFSFSLKPLTPRTMQNFVFHHNEWDERVFSVELRHWILYIEFNISDSWCSIY